MIPTREEIEKLREQKKKQTDSQKPVKK